VNSSTIRSQLIWAALFPLAFFGLLSILVTATVMSQSTLKLALQRNQAQVQSAAGYINSSPRSNPSEADLEAALRAVGAEDRSTMIVVDGSGEVVASTRLRGVLQNPAEELPLSKETVVGLVQKGEAGSQLVQETKNGDEVVLAYAPFSGGQGGVLLVEPWQAIMQPVLYYQVLLVALLILGTTLSLVMLSASLGRVIHPLGELSLIAGEAVPGSVFHPAPEEGPLEIQVLTKAFNQMVIRLAEQQSGLRQYAHQALLSQERERQRLSHELHDGILQDLVGLAQRVELGQASLEQDPTLARQRLEELRGLVEQTLGEVRRISNALRPPVLDDLGLSIAVDALCNDLKLDRPGVWCEYSVSGRPRRLPPDIELAVYRVVQEALTNIRKHVKDVQRVEVRLVFDEHEILARVCNDGGSFTNPDVKSLVRSGHLGLAGMYERARLFEGGLEITTDEQMETIVELKLPV
jgi:signal transduction histidine kinase